MAVVTHGAAFSTLDGDTFAPAVTTSPGTPISAAKGKYKHFMQKEIYEQAGSLTDTMRGRVDLGAAKSPWNRHADPRTARGLTNLVTVACGTSYHSELVGQFMFERLARIPVRIDYGSEFRYRDPVMDEQTLLLSITQSGETVDTLAALEEGRDKGAPPGLHRQHHRQPGRAGGRQRHLYAHRARDRRRLHQGLHRLDGRPVPAGRLVRHAARHADGGPASHLAGRPGRPARPGRPILNQDNDRIYEQLAQTFFQYTDFLYLGRGINFPIALEGALKLKEISYIHAEGYPPAR